MQTSIEYSLIMLKKLFSLFLPLTLTFAFNANALNHQQVSDEVQKTLISAGFFPQKTNIITPAAGDFPYNISLDFFTDSFFHNENFEGLKTKAVIVFTQEDFLENSETILSFLSALQDFSAPIPVSILFAYSTSFSLPKAHSISGTESYIEQIFSQDSTFAVTVSFTDSNLSKIMAGNGGEASPLWLVKAAGKAFSQAKIKYTVPAGTFLTLYRYSLLEDNKNAVEFLDEDIPVLSIILSKNADLKSLMTTFLKNYDYRQSGEWDKHYFYWNFPSKNFCIILNETVLIRTFICAAIYCLFMLCAFSFFTGKEKLIYKKEIQKLIFLWPLTLLFACLALYASQYLSHQLSLNFRLTPVFQLFLEIQITFIAVSILFAIFIHFSPQYTLYTHKFYITLSTVVNIFLFSILDLSFFFLFAMEYLLLLFFKPGKRIYFFVITFIMLFIPFIPYGIILWQHIQINRLPQLIAGSQLKIFFTALAIQPFNLIWLIILSHFINIRKNKNIAAVIFKIFQLIFAGSLILFGCFYGLSSILNHYRKIPSIADIEKPVDFIEIHNENLNVHISDKSSYGNTVRELQISSKEPAERYEIIIKGQTVQPVYESTLPFVENPESTSAAIRLPDFPPAECNFSYTTTSKEGEEITVKAYYKISEKVFNVETKQVFIGKGEKS